MERTDSARTVKSEAELDMIRKGNARRMFRSRENMPFQKKEGTWVKDQKRRRRERKRKKKSNRNELHKCRNIGKTF